MNAEALNSDKIPAHALWVELTTRITTQPLHYRSGEEETAIKSVHNLFQKTRELIEKHPDAIYFRALSLNLLNRTLRPYNARWHRWITTRKAVPGISDKSMLIIQDEQVRRKFREELIELQNILSYYVQAFRALGDGKEIPANVHHIIQEFGVDKSEAHLGNSIIAGLPQSLKHINAVEHEEILQRRKNFNNKEIKTPLQNLTGLALSGGGIRSATFCLGIVQTLARKDLFHQFDYLSTVSGGGYLGTFLSSVLADIGERDKNKNPKEIIDDVLKSPHSKKESKAVRHLRNSSKYLGASGIKWMAGIMIFGILINLLLLLPVPLFIATGVYLLQHIGFWDIPQNPTLWTGLTASIAGQAFSWLLIMLVSSGFILPFVQSFTQGKHKSFFRDTLEKITLSLAIASFLAGTLYFIPSIFHMYAYLEGEFSATWQMIVAGLLPFLLAYGSKLLELWKRVQKLVLGLFVLSGPLFFLVVFLVTGNILGVGIAECVINNWNLPDWVSNTWPFLNQHSDAIWITLIALLLWVWGWFLVNINTISLHRYYRNRLCDCYLIKRKAQGDSVQVRTEMPLDTLFEGKKAAPYHLINTTVNLTTSKEVELRGRNGDFFLISKHFCGSPVIGYHQTKDVVRKNPQIDLGSAMAISGAAASTNMGWQTMKVFRFLMGVMNLRLGYWVMNPDSKIKIHCKSLEGPGMRYLYKEILGRMNESDRYLNLSDGGHIENLAAYELLRRKCKFIVCVDGGQDPGMECADLIRLQRYAEIDLGIRMEYDISDLRLNENRLSRAYAILVKIIYPGSAEETPKTDPSETELGWMLYIKLAVTSNEPAYVCDYRREHSTFPHQTTADQFFNEAQFEAYRMLGECAAESLFRNEIVGSSLPNNLHDWMQELANNLLPDNDPVFFKKVNFN